MEPLLNLTPDELLTTTRAVRKRLDFSRPVPQTVIEECLAVALQAPVASNLESRHFMVVTDTATKAAIAELYSKAWAWYETAPGGAVMAEFSTAARTAVQQRVVGSARYLADHLREAPVFVIPCIPARVEQLGVVAQATRYGSIVPAAWSFILAARVRGLGTCWTTLHLLYEREVAELLGIPYGEVTQVALLPVAYTKGTTFKAGPRDPLTELVHWGRW